ncbi:TMEM175 family protein [Actinocorallia sp. A-T 12471]|uniref:TMEM175 family protein n=1 Tax=Actinocorallia sp. A-T 12471 TaxID=3089813 RepID=UPI0029CF73B2|nr:TMEM175 family protein [Actinocorallia sp. A-T 12471]MDX6741924.1 TMEM175 family protein [Actinocorallia sp. A-T 12471]
MSTFRESERLVNFTDAVVAIALTLLVLPLVDAVGDQADRGGGAREFLADNAWAIFGFLLSFAVIARLWMVHHRLFQYVRAYNAPLMLWDLLWVLTIVWLPFPTEMISTFATSDRFTAGVYIGTILAASACQTVMAFLITRTPDIQHPETHLPRIDVLSSATATGLLLLALVVSSAIPGVTYYALLLLFLSPLVVRVLSRGVSSRDA